MRFAVNYSRATAELVRTRQIEIDCFKCPAWSDLIEEARGLLPVYIHLPLKVGSGRGEAFDTESGTSADWNKIESLLNKTDTAFINVHLRPRAEECADLPTDATDAQLGELLAERMIRDVRAVAARFGVERIISENDVNQVDSVLRPALIPIVIRRVVEESGCGFLLDLSHARLTAEMLGMEARSYITALPLQRVREIHITGIQRIEGRWLDAVRRDDPEFAARFEGQRFDHLPMTDEDWAFFAWAMERIHAGTWSQPHTITFEYGGVGKMWEAVTDMEMLKAQVPRLRVMIKEDANKQ